ncbi:hypothetical protein L1049_018887 [Liquidambar formosana]|uniref:Uncharacterized protein n=1 Tax=Liquidambar formosana TaxID=63359 RepID=A0AAP0WMV4_LIQFO
MAQKRKVEVTAVDESDRVLYSTFSNAANELSHLYSQALNYQKLAFEAGQRHALEKLNEWMATKQQEGLMVTTADISAYLQNELNTRSHPSNACHGRQNVVDLSFSSPLTEGQGMMKDRAAKGKGRCSHNQIHMGMRLSQLEKDLLWIIWIPCLHLFHHLSIKSRLNNSSGVMGYSNQSIRIDDSRSDNGLLIIVMLSKHIFLMRVWFCKIHCPSFICFCKPSPHLYTPGPLKLENTPHVPSTCVSLPDASDQLSGETIEIKEGNSDGKQQTEKILKSSLRKAPSEPGAPKELGKKRVQWMDFLGKELVEIKEFESSEIEDSDNDGDNNRGCVCIIL